MGCIDCCIQFVYTDIQLKVLKYCSKLWIYKSKTKIQVLVCKNRVIYTNILIVYDLYTKIINMPQAPKKFKQLYMEVGSKPIWYLRSLYNSVRQINGAKAQDQKGQNLPPSLSLFEFINLSYLTKLFTI